jgi:hypothetical protein
MITIDPVFGKAQEDEALISTALLRRTGHCKYRGQ